MTSASAGDGPVDRLAGAAGAWTLDPTASTIEFESKAMWGLAKVKGRFQAVEGGGVVATDGTVSGTLVIDARSVDTKNKKRDDHLRSGDFFEVDTYPTVIYTVTGASPVGDQVKVSGDLTIHGQTRPLEVVATVDDSGPDRVRITTEVDIDRSQWGLTWAKMGARLGNHVVVNAQFNKT
jgi:polyisoprenoid-binding protein YceI